MSECVGSTYIRTYVFAPTTMRWFTSSFHPLPPSLPPLPSLPPPTVVIVKFQGLPEFTPLFSSKGFGMVRYYPFSVMYVYVRMHVCAVL